MTNKTNPPFVCAYCGRQGWRGFVLRYGDGQAPQTDDWRCANGWACEKRAAKTAWPRDGDSYPYAQMKNRLFKKGHH